MLKYFSNKKAKNKDAKDAKAEEEAVRHAAEQPLPQESPALEEQPKQTQTATLERPRGETRTNSGRQVLDRADESFLQNLLSEEGPAPPLPARVNQPEIDWPSDDASSFQHATSTDESIKGKGKEKEKEKEDGKPEEAKKANRLSILFSKATKKKPKHGDSLKPEDAKTENDLEKEVEIEAHDLDKVLDRLNLSAKNNKVMALSDDSAEVLRKFTQIFKDLANGVPTAYDDLVSLLKDREGTINKAFEKLPSGLQKLVMQLPEKVTGSIAPEVLMAAAKSQGVEATKETMLSPQALLKLLTEPGALVGMLRAIVTALQQRWPAFIGVNVLWSVALCLLMFVLWYCYKRGRETRLEKEKSHAEASAAGESSTLIESDDRPASPGHLLEAGPSTDRSPVERKAQHDEGL